MASLNDWLNLLRKKIAGKLPEDDCATAEGIFKKIVEQANDADYGIGPKEHSGIKVDVTTRDSSDTFLVTVRGRRNVSMRNLKAIVRSYPDIFELAANFAPAVPGQARTIDIDVTVYKTASKAQRGLVKIEGTVLKDVKAQINGMDLAEDDRNEARVIARRVLNMDIYGRPMLWQFANCPSSPAIGESYLIMAYPVKGISLSFFNYLVDHHPCVENIILRTEPYKDEPDTAERVEIHARCLSESPAPAPAPAGAPVQVSRRRVLAGSGTVDGGIHKKARPAKARGLLARIFG